MDMKKRKGAARLCLCLTAAMLLLTVPAAAEEPEPLPEFGALAQEEPALEDIQYTSLGGTPCIVEVYTVPPEYPSGNLGKEGFQKEGFQKEGFQKEGFQKEGRNYVREAVLKVRENYVTESRLASQTMTVSHEGREGAAARFVPFLDYENGGYQGQLTLDASSIFTEAAGTQSYSYPLSETREYTGLQRNDTYYIPKSVVKNGVTLALSDVDWTAMGDGTCRAQARYAGTGYGSRTTGYVSTGTYVGTVERRTLESVTYKVIYAGKPIPVVKPSLWPWILSGLGVLILAGGVLLFFCFKPNGKLCAVVGGTRLKTVRRLRISRIHPFVDASAPEYGGYEELLFYPYPGTMKWLSGRKVTVKFPDGHTESCPMEADTLLIGLQEGSR